MPAPKSVISRIEQLRHVIDEERHKYHVTGEKGLSEAALDSLKKELFDLEQQYPELITQDSPTQRVSGAVAKGFSEVRHRVRMMSLNDAFFRADMDDWENRIKKLLPLDAKLDYYCELKIDGLAIGLRYENGLLAQGFTRGDGFVGEDVTHNIKTIESIPLKLRGKVPSDLEVRGEVYMEKKQLDIINAQREKDGETPYANVRNLAVGSLRQLDSSVTASRKLQALIYDIVIPDGIGSRHSELHELARQYGFKISEHTKKCASLDEVQKYWEHWQGKAREKLSLQLDGVVVWVDDIALQKQLGIVGKAPRYGIAWKFPAEQVTTILEAVDFQVGRTGVLTPVAHLTPVSVAGTTVSRATLHNMDEIKRLDVHIGDTVVIQKAGDIIPEVVEVVAALRPEKAKRIHAPKTCPICHSPVVRPEGEVAVYCKNKNCYAQLLRGLIHFSAKGAFDIEGLGQKNVEALVQADLLRTPADIYRLQVSDLEGLERFGELSANNLIEAIERSKKVTFGRFIFGLGIRHVGDVTARALAEKFKTVEKFLALKPEDLESVPDIGEVVTDSIVEYVSNPEHVAMVRDLISLGVHPYLEKRAIGTLTGRLFLFTGTLKAYSREEAGTLVRKHGGEVSDTLTKQVTDVVVGDKPGSKAEKAKGMGIGILDEKGFEKLIKI